MWPAAAFHADQGHNYCTIHFLIHNKDHATHAHLAQHHKHRSHVPNVPDAEIVKDWPFTGGSGVKVTCKLCKWSLCHTTSHAREAASSKQCGEHTRETRKALRTTPQAEAQH